MHKVLIALSGGVDSSVAAALLQEQGHEIIGCIGVMHGDTLDNPDVDAARTVALRLNIPFQVIDLRDAFEQHVIKPFCNQYQRGLTPSPCIECNRFVKFGALQDTMQQLGCTHIATGHYARIICQGNRFELHKAIDSKKDQSYMLARLTQDQLSHALFPLGTLAKDEVRERARNWGFSNANRPESQDICFIPDGNYAKFIVERTANGSTVNQTVSPFDPGPFVDPDGTILGEHRGIIHYTIGQRKGIGLAFGTPHYVCGIDAASRTVTIGTADDLLTRNVKVHDFSWIAGTAPASPFRCTAKIRYRQTEQDTQVLLPDANAADVATVLLRFGQPQRAVTPGQYAVLYDGTRVLGAGMISVQ